MRTLLIALFTVLPAAAELPSEPPMYLHLIRSPGGGTGLPRTYDPAGPHINVFGLRSVTGPSETWQLECHDSFQSIEDVDMAIRTSLRSLPAPAEQWAQIAMYRPNWSYRPDLAIKAFVRARYFQVSVHHFRAGGDNDFGEIMKARRNGLDRINLDRPDIVYQVVSGSTRESFIVLTPLASLKTLDDAMARMPASGESGARPRDKIAADIELNRENFLLRVDPKISIVNPSFAGADPDFWKQQNR